MAKKFNGVVNIDVRDSVPDWTPFRESPAPEGAPNVLVGLYDDTGLAAWSPDDVGVGAHVLGMEFAKESHGEHGEAVGTATLYVDDLLSRRATGRPNPVTSRCAARA